MKRGRQGLSAAPTHGERLATLALGMFPWACASAPPQAPITTAANSVEAPPAQAPRGSIGSAEILCAGDDDPAPIGVSAPGLRVLPAQPEVHLRWEMGPELMQTRVFRERKDACELLVDSNDAGERTFALRKSPNGVPVASRLEGETSASTFTTCIAKALCALSWGRGGPTGSPSRVVLETEIEAAVFRGSVRIAVGDERRDVAGSADRRRGRPSVPASGPRLPAGDAYADQMALKIRPGAEDCARMAPPDRNFQTTIVFTWGARGRELVHSGLGSDPFVASFASCLASVAETVLVRPPPKRAANDRLPISAWVDTRPPGPEPKPEML